MPPGKYVEHVMQRGPARRSHTTARDDLHSVVGPETQQTRLAAEHHNAQLGISIFEREIKVSGIRRTEVGNFAFDPNVRVAALHSRTDRAHQIGNTPYAPRW